MKSDDEMRRQQLRSFASVLATLLWTATSTAVAAKNQPNIGQLAPELHAEQGTWISATKPFKLSELKQGQLALVFFQTVY
jgi:hypothetical protein